MGSLGQLAHTSTNSAAVPGTSHQHKYCVTMSTKAWTDEKKIIIFLPPPSFEPKSPWFQPTSWPGHALGFPYYLEVLMEFSAYNCFEWSSFKSMPVPIILSQKKCRRTSGTSQIIFLRDIFIKLDSSVPFKQSTKGVL